MVLSSATGGEGFGSAPRLSGEDGSQALELALVLPFVVLAIVVLLHVAVLGADLVGANALALQAARAAAIGDDAAVEASVRDAVGARPVQIDVEPPDTQRAPGDDVTATIRLRSRAFEPFGATLWLPARVTMRVEQ